MINDILNFSKTVKNGEMIRLVGYLRLFYFHKTETTILNDAGEVLVGNRFPDSTISETIESFFYGHADQCDNDLNIQNFRFQNRFSEIIQHTLNSFGTIAEFEIHSQLIADKLANSLTNSTMRNNFYLIVFSTAINGRECLCIFRMEANIGIQVTEEITLNTLERMLPDKKSRLQKAAIIFREETNNFYLENEEAGDERNYIHSKIIDRVDPGISGYFFKNFLDSYRVIDRPESSAQIAIESIVEVSNQYLLDGVSKTDIEEMLRKDLSVQKETSYNSLLGVISGRLDNNKLQQDELDSASLSIKIYEYAKSVNNTVVPTFEAKYRFPPKVKITDSEGQGRISISYFKSLQDQGFVSWGLDREDNNYSILRVNNDLIEMN